MLISSTHPYSGGKQLFSLKKSPPKKKLSKFFSITDISYDFFFFQIKIKADNKH